MHFTFYMFGTVVHVWYCGTCLVLWYMFGTVVHVWYCGKCLIFHCACDTCSYGSSILLWTLMVTHHCFTRVQTWAAEEPVEPKKNFHCLCLIDILSGNAKNYTQRAESEYFLIYQRRAQNQPRSIVGTSFVGADTNEYRWKIMPLIKFL